jgi:flotillin
LPKAEATRGRGREHLSARVAESDAKLAEVRAGIDASGRRRRGQCAGSDSSWLSASRRLARLSKEQLAPQEIEKKRIEIAAEAEAEKRRREAQGEADAELARYLAEAEGTQKVLEAKAEGYRQLMEACAANPQVAPTLLLIEQLPLLVAEQVKAIQNLKIDKITVWDSGATDIDGSRGTTAGFLSGLIGSLPQIHELADQAGIDLPPALGKLRPEPPRPKATVPQPEPEHQDGVV